MNVIKEIERINQNELQHGIYGGSEKGSWHDKYKNSAWVYIGGLSYDLSEGDIICFMSQWGEIEDINLVREKGTNKSKGFAFLKYEDQRSTILAVDNFNGIPLLGRNLRVDHVDQYKLPKEVREREEERLEMDPEAQVEIGPGHAYSSKSLENEFSIQKGLNLWEKSSSNQNIEEDFDRHSKQKKEKKKKHSKKSDRKHGSHHSDSDGSRKKKRKSVEEEIDEFMQGVLPLPQQVEASNFMPKMVESNEPLPVALDATGAILPPTETSASWRGRMDPERIKAITDYKERMEKAEKMGPQTKREEFAGFGGMNRRR